MKRKAVLVSILINSLISTVYAENKVYKNRLNVCEPTKSIVNNHEPENFNPTNNLLKAIGGEKFGINNEIIFVGKISDKNCVPISDAKVYIWQKGADGKYPYKPFRNLNPGLFDKNNKTSFLGSGIARSDNNGYFTFVTTTPPVEGKKMPNVSLRVEHNKFGTLQTSVHIPYSPCEMPTDKKYNINIVMDVEQVNKRY